MAEKTEIAWCDSTHNEWVGCQKVSAGCDNCFAEGLMDTRYHRVEWGQRKMPGVAPSVGTRSLTSVANRRKPHSWQRKAAAFRAEHGRRQRVFCSSLSDIFDNQVPDEWRIGLWETIRATPDLDWLLLTKRPENIEKMLPVSWRDDFDLWQHVWLGTTCEDQAAYDKRWPILRDIPAKVRFISYEPAIGPLRLPKDQVAPDWLICGGESGAGFRDMSRDWVESIRGDCQAMGAAFFFKQMAGKKPIPADLMVREFPVAA
jgi:protein gp37